MLQDMRIPQRRVHKVVSLRPNLKAQVSQVLVRSGRGPRCAEEYASSPSRFQGVLGYYVTRHGTASEDEVSRKESFVLTGNSFEEEIQ